MAIARDNAASLGFTSSVSTKTAAYTVNSVTGGGLLVAFIFGDSSSDLITAGTVTYAGTAMVQQAKIRANANRWLYCYTLANPATGSNNVIVTATGTCEQIGIQAISYTGTIELDVAAVTASLTGTQNISASITPVSSGCWLTYCAQETTTTNYNSYTNCTQQVNATWSAFGWWGSTADSDGTVSVAAHTLTATNSGTGTDMVSILIALRPFVYDVASMSWKADCPDILLDTTVEMVDSGFTPRSPQDSIDPTPN